MIVSKNKSETWYMQITFIVWGSVCKYNLFFWQIISYSLLYAHFANVFLCVFTHRTVYLFVVVVWVCFGVCYVFTHLCWQCFVLEKTFLGYVSVAVLTEMRVFVYSLAWVRGCKLCFICFVELNYVCKYALYFAQTEIHFPSMVVTKVWILIEKCKFCVITIESKA